MLNTPISHRKFFQLGHGRIIDHNTGKTQFFNRKTQQIEVQKFKIDPNGQPLIWNTKPEKWIKAPVEQIVLNPSPSKLISNSTPGTFLVTNATVEGLQKFFKAKNPKEFLNKLSQQGFEQVQFLAPGTHKGPVFTLAQLEKIAQTPNPFSSPTSKPKSLKAPPRFTKIETTPLSLQNGNDGALIQDSQKGGKSNNFTRIGNPQPPKPPASLMSWLTNMFIGWWR